VLMIRFAFENLNLHRIQVAIVPRNDASRRVAEKLALREEGISQGYLQIRGTWEDHVRYAMTVEEWAVRCQELSRQFLGEAAVR